MMLHIIGVLVTVLAVLPLVLFVAVYARANWRGNVVGRTMMTLVVSEAVILLMSLILQIWGVDTAGLRLTRIIVFLVVVFALWRQLYVLVQVRRGNPRFLKGLSETTETKPDRSDDLTP